MSADETHAFLLATELVETVGRTPAGSIAMINVEGPTDVPVIKRWCDATGNTVLAVHQDAVEIYRGVPNDPVAVLPLERRPGYRLWIYTNFHCNLACDYCCVGSSPRAEPRSIAIDEFASLVDAATSVGVSELHLTGGEPFSCSTSTSGCDSPPQLGRRRYSPTAWSGRGNAVDVWRHCLATI